MLTGSLLTIFLRGLKENLGILAVQEAGWVVNKLWYQVVALWQFSQSCHLLVCVRLDFRGSLVWSMFLPKKRSADSFSEQRLVIEPITRCEGTLIICRVKQEHTKTCWGENPTALKLAVDNVNLSYIVWFPWLFWLPCTHSTNKLHMWLLLKKKDVYL